MRDEFQSLVLPLIGRPMALPWQGYGSAIFLELGQLSQQGTSRRNLGQGEVSICLEWHWRVESGVTVLFGDANSSPAIARGLATLQGTRIDALSLLDPIPDLLVHLSNGHRLRSMLTQDGDPAWWISLHDGSTVFIEAGALRHGDGVKAVSPQEKAASAHAEATAVRWGASSANPESGRCLDCRWFQSIDGAGDFLDYGVCSAATSPFDARAVHCDGVRPSFTVIHR